MNNHFNLIIIGVFMSFLCSCQSNKVDMPDNDYLDGGIQLLSDAFQYSDDYYWDINPMPSMNEYKTYKRFNEFKMEGEGFADSSSHVYVWKNRKYCYVKKSENTDSIIKYRKKGDYWINQVSFRWWNKSGSFVKDCVDQPATRYFRAVKNDTIYEYCQTSVNDNLSISFYLKTHDLCFRVNISRFQASKYPFDTLFDIIKAINTGDRDKNITQSSTKYEFVLSHNIAYYIFEDGKYLSCFFKEYSDENELDILPGFESYKNYECFSDVIPLPSNY